MTVFKGKYYNKSNSLICSVKLNHFTVMQTLKPGKDNTYLISCYNHIQIYDNLFCSLVLW